MGEDRWGFAEEIFREPKHRWGSLLRLRGMMCPLCGRLISVGAKCPCPEKAAVDVPVSE
jgi:hypothetical protein